MARYLQEQGYEVVSTHEPGGTKLGEYLRQLVLWCGYGEITPEAELFLYEASRAEHVARVVRPALEAGQVVLCDRFSDSTLAYQGYGRGLDLGRLRSIDALATRGQRPDLTLILDMPVQESYRRLRQRGREADRLEAQEDGFRERLRQGYQILAREEPDRVVLLDAAAPVETVFGRLREAVDRFLERKNGADRCG